MGKCALETFSLESDQSLPQELVKYDPLDRPEVVIGVCTALRDLVQHTFPPKVTSLELATTLEPTLAWACFLWAETIAQRPAASQARQAPLKEWLGGTDLVLIERIMTNHISIVPDQNRICTRSEPDQYQIRTGSVPDQNRICTRSYAIVRDRTRSVPDQNSIVRDRTRSVLLFRRSVP